MSIPTRVFIVPYRDRKADKDIFLQKMKTILENFTEPYEIYFAHQYDNRPFNRGAMKNIGFLAIKKKYPTAYKEITFIFHDVDTYPCEKGLIDYTTTTGIVKHYYGFTFALGGIFAIKGADFEKTKGFPNFWGWGLEDNAIYDRCLSVGLLVDRSCFYDTHDKRVIRNSADNKRLISKRDSFIYKQATHDDIHSLKNIKWQFKNEYINITNFECSMNPKEQLYDIIDVRKTSKIKIPRAYQIRRNWNMFGK